MRCTVTSWEQAAMCGQLRAAGWCACWEWEDCCVRARPRGDRPRGVSARRTPGTGPGSRAGAGAPCCAPPAPGSTRRYRSTGGRGLSRWNEALTEGSVGGWQSAGFSGTEILQWEKVTVSCRTFIHYRARCSSVVRACAHGAMGCRIDPS